MLEIMKLSVGLTKLRDLAGGNYVAGPLEIEKSYVSEHQTLKIATIAFKLDDFKKSAKVTDEEIAKSYEENKEIHKTAEKRALRYVFFENPKEQENVPLEERQKRQREVVERVNKFNDASIAAGAKFEAIVKQLKETEQKTELFTREAAPEALKKEADLLEAAFALNPASRPISDPVKGANGYYIFTVSQVEASKQQQLAEVKDKVREALVARKAQEGLTQAVNDAREALNKGLAEGKKLADLAKERKLTLSLVSELTISEPPAELSNAYEIAGAVRDLPVGSLSASIDIESGALLAYVEARELRKREDSSTLRDNLARTRSDMDQRRLFETWFAKLRDAAQPRLLLKETTEGA
jgi:hypothetical protein